MAPIHLPSVPWRLILSLGSTCFVHLPSLCFPKSSLLCLAKSSCSQRKDSIHFVAHEMGKAYIRLGALTGLLMPFESCGRACSISLRAEQNVVRRTFLLPYLRTLSWVAPACSPDGGLLCHLTQLPSSLCYSWLLVSFLTLTSI